MLPYIEQKQTTQVDDMPSQPDEEDTSDLLVNNLVYTQPKELSLAKSRTHTKQFFQRSDYANASGKTAICEWNSGSSYIDVSNSFLVFDVKVNTSGATGDTYTFGKGSAMNLVNRITIRTKSGSEVERLENANLWSKVDTQYSLPENYAKTVGSMMGMGTTDQRLEYVADTKTIRMSVPLARLCPFMRPLKGQHMPPQLASGLHFEIVFETGVKGFVFPAPSTATVTSYDVTNIHFVLDSIDLSDEAQKSINLESADNGLEWCTPRIYSIQTQMPTGVNQSTVQVRKAVSQATQAYSVLQDQATVDSQQLDSFASTDMVDIDALSWQYNIGSLYFPNQKVDDPDNYTLASSYQEALYAWDKTKHPFHGCDVSIKDFKTDSAIFAMTSSRDDSLYLSGLNVNNSRVLQYRMEFVDGNVQNRTLTTFLEYVQIAKCYMSNSIVSI